MTKKGVPITNTSAEYKVLENRPEWALHSLGIEVIQGKRNLIFILRIAREGYATKEEYI